jgi:hypothetical protein
MVSSFFTRLLGLALGTIAKVMGMSTDAILIIKWLHKAIVV